MIEQVEFLSGCVAARWRPTIGDPTMMGWATVAAYALAAAIAARTRGRARADVALRRERLFWGGLALGLAVLAINKQLDLQSALTALGRCEAQRSGWYAQRRGVQIGFVIGLGALALAVSAGLAMWLRRSLRRLWLTLLGVCLLCGFVMIRAIGFHHIDGLIGVRLGGLRVNWVLEIGSLGLICLGAVVAAGSRDPRRAS